MKHVRANVNVVFSAPNKLLKQVNLLNKPEKRKTNVKSSTAPGCTEGTVYFIPLSCGRQYIGRAEQCLNDRLREHRSNILNTGIRHLAIHCRDCAA